MADERSHLAQVDRHIAETKEHIRKQQRLIERLIAWDRGGQIDRLQFQRLIDSVWWWHVVP